MEKKDWVEEVAGGCFLYNYNRVGGTGRFLVSLSAVKENVVAYLG